MNRSIAVLICISAFLAFATNGNIEAQDCERAIEGNTQSPCKQLDYLQGMQPPVLLVEQFTDPRGNYACQSFLEFRSTTALQGHSQLAVAGGSQRVANTGEYFRYLSSDLSAHNWYENISFATSGSYYWANAEPPYLADETTIRVSIDWPLNLDSKVAEHPPQVYPYLIVAAQFGTSGQTGSYVVVSDAFQSPRDLDDYQLLMNQCLAGISRQLELDATEEAAREQAAEDKAKAELAAEEAKNQAALAEIELASAEAALQAAEVLNVALLQETILAIKREDAIRAAWQQVLLVRLAGLEERTKIWNEAVNRWAEEALRFSSAMEARIQEVERLQSLNSALEQSMTEQRRILIAQLEELERAEQDAMQTRDGTN